MKIQLSISMLASNRSTSLERCLDSLRPLLMQVPSELIIVFTGTDEKVKEIAGRYTDKIIPFKWCNNFSAARNVGLWAAKGEWFLYIDDDEWFDDITEIVEFFTSGEYQRYGYACYIQRNYVDWEGLHYADYHAFRMVRKVPGIAFQNAIHEELVPRMDPGKYFNAYVHHYGYVSDSGVTSLEKAQRNTPLLEQSIKERPNYIKNYLQIVQEYAIEGEWKKAEEFCRKGRKLCHPSNDNDYWRWLQMKLVEILHESGDEKRTEKESLRILKEEDPSEIVKLELCIHLIAIYVERGVSEKVIEYAERFEEILEYMDKNPQLWSKQSYAEMTERKVKVPSRINHIRMNGVNSALRLGNPEKAAYFLKLLPWEEEYWMQQYYEMFDQWAQVYRGDGLFGKLLEDFPEDAPYTLLQKAKTLKIPEREREEEHLQDSSEGNQKERLPQELPEGEQKKQPPQKSFEETQEGQKPQDSPEATRKAELLEQCIRRSESFRLQYQAVEEAVQSRMDLSPLVQSLDLDTWQRCAISLMNCFAKTDLPLVWEAAKMLKQGAPVYGLWLEKLLRERELIRTEYSNSRLMETLSEYIQCILRYYGEQYRKEVFTKERYHILPKDCRFAVLAAEAVEKMEAMELPEAVRLFRSAIQFYPCMTGVIREVTRHMTAMTSAPAQAAGAEFQALAVQMKEVLKSMLDRGQYTEAMSVVNQLSPLLPEDLEFLRLRQKVLQKQ